MLKGTECEKKGLLAAFAGLLLAVGGAVMDVLAGGIQRVVLFWVRYLQSWVWWLQGCVAFIYETEERQALRQMEQAETYKEWRRNAILLDHLRGLDTWKENPSSHSYDWVDILHRTEELRELMERKDLPAIVTALRTGLLRNLGGVGNEELYLHSHEGTKTLIHRYHNIVCKLLVMVRDSNVPALDHRRKYDFFKATFKSYGRTALLLSGGAGLGMYHFGVVKALYQESLLPRVISGASVGSLIAAVVGVTPDAEMPRIFERGSFPLAAFEKKKKGALMRKAVRLLTQGVIFDISQLESIAREAIGDVTFQEAFDRTDRILNITVSSTNSNSPARILNYLTAPDVLIWSAACASCALQFLYKPVQLMCKSHSGQVVPYHASGLQWSDGSVQNDLPMKRLSQLFNVNHFIVSQVNPHVIPFLQDNRKIVHDCGFWSSVYSFVKYFAVSEVHHRLLQLMDIGLIPKFGILLQGYRGDITIVPKLNWWDYTKLISNPTEDFRQHCILEGERSTWPKICIVRLHTMVERVLEECVMHMRLTSPDTLSHHHLLQKQIHTAEELERDGEKLLDSAKIKSSRVV
eukprot:TRINITY_DN11381_c1_g1_i1.p1 TRINITY_DN11381_c1_g1~~TRINITY_DN11381_c1_g1_i1.p1  ORF type:complete len:619 (-),score=220.56 TRINITY_DN11381_c1_g1_i1:130-1860(-)